MKYVMTKRDRALLIGLFGLLIFGAVYYFVYIGYTDKTTALKNENSGLQNRVDVLQSISDQQGDLISKTSANNQKVEEILKKFPSLVLEEDGIMLAVELQLNSPLETISAIGINIPEEIYTVADIKGMTDEVVNGYIPNATVQQVAPEEEAAPAAEASADPRCRGAERCPG